MYFKHKFGCQELNICQQKASGLRKCATYVATNASDYYGSLYTCTATEFVTLLDGSHVRSFDLGWSPSLKSGGRKEVSAQLAFANAVDSVLNEAEGRVRQPGNAVTGMSHKTRVSGPMCL